MTETKPGTIPRRTPSAAATGFASKPMRWTATGSRRPHPTLAPCSPQAIPKLPDAVSGAGLAEWRGHALADVADEPFARASAGTTSAKTASPGRASRSGRWHALERPTREGNLPPWAAAERRLGPFVRTIPSATCAPISRPVNDQPAHGATDSPRPASTGDGSEYSELAAGTNPLAMVAPGRPLLRPRRLWGRLASPPRPGDQPLGADCAFRPDRQKPRRSASRRSSTW